MLIKQAMPWFVPVLELLVRVTISLGAGWAVWNASAKLFAVTLVEGEVEHENAMMLRSYKSMTGER